MYAVCLKHHKNTMQRRPLREPKLNETMCICLHKTFHTFSPDGPGDPDNPGTPLSPYTDSKSKLLISDT